MREFELYRVGGASGSISGKSCPFAFAWVQPRVSDVRRGVREDAGYRSRDASGYRYRPGRPPEVAHSSTVAPSRRWPSQDGPYHIAVDSRDV